MKQTMDKMELFRLIDTKEDWLRTQEFLNTLRTEKMQKAEAESGEKEQKKTEEVLGQ